MTVTLLQPYATYPAGVTVTLDRSTELSLIRQNRATGVANTAHNEPFNSFQGERAELDRLLPLSGYSTPQAYGAYSDGKADDTVALARAGAQAFAIHLPPGTVTRITSDVVVGILFNEGGLIDIPAGKTLTFYSVVGDPAVPCFQGLGRAVPQNASYSLGWYAGTTANEKAAFYLRSANTGVRKQLVIPAPATTDPAYIADLYGTPAYKVSAPLPWGDLNNNTIVDCRGALKAVTYGMAAILEVSNLAEKAEDVTFKDLRLDCDDKAFAGILGHGGARFRFEGKTMIYSPVWTGIEWPNDYWPADECYFQFVYVVRYGRRGMSLGGSGAAPSDASTNCINSGALVDYYFDGGARGLYATVTSVTGGAITGLTVNNTAPGKTDPQKLTGFEAGATFFINGYNTTGLANAGGYGGTAMATVNNTTGVIDPASVAITAGGTNFAVNDIVILTTAENGLRIRGWTDALTVRKVKQTVVLPQVAQAGALVSVVGTTAGASNGLTITDVRSNVRNRQLVDITNEAGATFMHSFTLSNVRNRFAVQDPTKAMIGVNYTDDATIADLTRQTAGTILVTVATNNTSNIAFKGIPKERISFFGPNFTLDGEPTYYTTSRPIDSVFVLNTKSFSGFTSMRRVTLVSSNKDGSNNPNVYGSWYMTDDNTLVPDGAIGSLVDTVSNAGSSGTSGTAGRFRVSVSNGILYGENRVVAGLRCEMVAHR